MQLKSHFLFPRFPRLLRANFFAFFAASAFVCIGVLSNDPVGASDDVKAKIEAALYTKAEFFGAEAVVPFPTAEARERLSKVADEFPDNAEILRQLARFDEQLARYDSAENLLRKIAELENNFAAHENLADFYERRGRYERSAEIMEKLLEIASEDNRPPAFRRLIEFARVHGLEKYQNAAFYQSVAARNPSAFAVVESVVDELSEQENYADALKILRDAKNQFSGNREKMFKKEIELLRALNQSREVEKVCLENFDPFWDEETMSDFYGFLDSENRLRAYGKELKDALKRDPANFALAVRLSQYQQNDGVYDNDSSVEIFNRLESSRRAAKIEWSADELLTTARILLAENETDAASRHLYTLSLEGGLAPGSELRRKVLYQLFTIFSNAGAERIALVKGDLQFYKDVATADVNPGIATGILSLIFADARPQAKLDEKETAAARLFNRAAAYRIFQEFKETYADAPETAQMYLDTVRFYAAQKETEIAEKTLAEFEQAHEKSKDYAAAALKLADAFAATDKRAKEYEICRKLLDYLGGQKKFQTAPEAPLEIVNTYDEPPKYADFTADDKEEITYDAVLKRIIERLAKENKIAEILALYSGEVEKYPAHERLYENRLAWLGQTNLAEEELKAYRQALEKFPTRSWQDKLARWFLRRSRYQEFAEFSAAVIEKLDDEETEKYLTEFAARGASPADFDAQIYLKLHLRAHERYPHNLKFITSLLDFYEAHKQPDEWRKLAAAHFFEFAPVRRTFIRSAAQRGELRAFLQQARERVADNEITPANVSYALFRADAAVHLAGFEEAVGAYRRVNELYPNKPEYEEKLINLTRSFGQKSVESLREAAHLAQMQAENSPSNADSRTRSGELQAELGDYEKADAEWRKMIETARGTNEIYLATATVEWDYFQYDAALKTIADLRGKTGDDRVYAFQIAALYEAKGEPETAVREYVKALGAGSADDADGERAANRLAKLAKRNDLAATIDAAFQKEKARRKDALPIALDYAEVLQKNERGEQARNILRNAISASRDARALERAEHYLSNRGDFGGSRLALARLAETAANPKDAIVYRLRLAENLAEDDRREQAKNVLSALLVKFPTNYGALKESAEILWRMNLRDDAIGVLRSAAARGKGEYRYIFSRRLAAKLVTENRFSEAETVLFALHETDKTNTEVFRELAHVYVRTGNAAKLRETFAETLRAVRAQEIETDEKRSQTAEFRRRMIEAFTELRDYRSAVEQHIEIINREPDEAANVEAAIDYAKRYGGADVLLEYYKKTAAEAHKNYRWNTVLAQIYEAGGDPENAAQNYKTAILNQPEMPELYVALATLETKRKNFDAALENVERILELTNEDLRYIRLKIEILEKAGRMAEATAEREKLPGEIRPRLSVSEQFATARNAPEAEKSIENYRRAFDALLENPYAHDLKSADVSGYVETLRTEENLNQIAERLWLLREKYAEDAEAGNSLDAGKAREQLKIFDAAMPEAVGAAAKNLASSEENNDLQKDLSRRIDDNFGATNRHETLALLQTIANRAGFGALEEKLLVKRLEASRGREDFYPSLKSLARFYEERGMFPRTGELLEREKANLSGNLEFLTHVAANARITGDTAKEIAALGEIYRQTDGKSSAANEQAFARYLEILHANGEGGKAQLAELAGKPSPFQFQLINFLIGKGETALAHRAIAAAPLAPSWKLARNAETSLALAEYGAANECYFCDALRLAPVGELVLQKPDQENHLTGDDWFRLARQYGEWLAAAPDEAARSDVRNFLPAMTENLPQSADEQNKLGAFYLEKSDAKNALEHFWLAAEIAPENPGIKANLGTAYFKTGDRAKAFELWDELLKSEKPEIKDLEFYFQTLHKNGLGKEASEKMFKPLVGKLEGFGYSGGRNDEEEMRSLLRLIAASFADKNEKFVFFKRLGDILDEDTFLPETLVNESLIEAENRAAFYEMLIARTSDSPSYERDYDYESALQKSLNANDAEEILEQENAYKIKEPTGEKIVWQNKYLAFLLERGRTADAKNLVSAIENRIARRYARPFWLRLAKLRLQLAAGNLTETASAAKRLIGIEIKTNAAKINLPDIARLNEVVKMFRAAGRETEARETRAAFYARMLALGRFEAAHFVGLAGYFYENGDAENGSKLLRLLNDLGDDARRETALAEIAALEIVKARAAQTAAQTAENYDGDANESLRLAAEIASEFGHTDAAIEFRQRLFENAPEDATNVVELARIFAANGGDAKESVKLLAHVLVNKNALKNDRWRAIWAAREIVRDKRSLLNEIAGADGEIRSAVEILANDRIEIKTENPSPQFWFLIGLTAKSFGQNAFAINAFERSLLGEKTAQVEIAFGENSAAQQLVELHIRENQPLIALAIAENDRSAKSDVLLELLTKTAESVGDYEKAIAYEKAKTAEKISPERVRNLQVSAASVNVKATDYAVDAEKTRKL